MKYYKYTIQAIIIGLIIFVSTVFFKPVKAELQEVFIPVPVIVNIDPVNIDVVRTSAYWYDSKAVHGIIDIYNDFGSLQAEKAFKDFYLPSGIVHKVNSGYVNVIYSHTYEGWWIFKLDR